MDALKKKKKAMRLTLTLTLRRNFTIRIEVIQLESYS